MRCAQCRFVMPRTDPPQPCVKCGGELIPTAEELLSEPDYGFVKEIRPGQIELTKAIEQALETPGHVEVFAEGGCGVGKAQPLSARISTPTGWTTMDAIHAGDAIHGTDGLVYEVTGVFPQGMREVFRVFFTDGTSTECCAEHWWPVWTKKDRARRRPWHARQLRDLQREGLTQGRTGEHQNEHRHWIPITQPVVFAPNHPTTPLTLDPYLLGVLLGDGGFTHNACTICMYDAFVVEELRRLLPDTCELVERPGARKHTYAIVGKARLHHCNAVINALHALGLMNHGSPEKFIPSRYMHSSFEIRIALLQGLFDADGGVNQNRKNGGGRGHVVEFSSTSERLANDTRELIQSLGGITSFKERQTYYTYRGERRPGRPSFRLHPCLPPTIQPFRLPRKRDAYVPRTEYLPRRAIHHIELVGVQEVQCISTSAPDHCYLTDHYIVTHNTFAYGTPAVLTGQRVVISTAKKSLQDQLEVKDIPFLQKKLGRPKQFVSLKGKSNYICKRLVKKERSLFEKNDQLGLWQRLSDWMEQDAVGDLSSFPGELEFPATICTAEECIGRCKLAKECGYWITKETMKDADLVITNHSLLGFDLRFGVGRLLGPYQILIIDEAHAAPDYLRRAFSEEVSETWLRSFLKKLGREQIDTPSVSESKDVPKWEALFQGIPEERLLPPNFFDPELLKYNLDMLTRLRGDLTDAVRKRWAPHSPEKDFSKLCKLAEEAIFGGDVDLGTIEGGSDSDTEYEDLVVLVKHYTKAESNYSALNATTGTDPDYINCREETVTGKIKIVRQPVNLIPFVKGPLKMVDKVIFASATLNAPILKSELGMTPAVEITQPSPFNYKANGLVYIPQHLPRPDEDSWPFAIAQEMVQLIRAAQGNALVLFSAKNDMVRTLEMIETNYEMDDFPIFAQTEGARPKEIMKKFEETEHASIFGLKSFFEGIDIQGLKLRLVILTKIPFPHMKDPLCQAKKGQLGDKWWNNYYYPTMLTDVQQAAGRLIRTATDRGVLAIFDVRMWVGSNKGLDPTTVGTPTRPWKGYGYNIFRALPFSNYTPRRELTLKFLKSLAR